MKVIVGRIVRARRRAFRPLLAGAAAVSLLALTACTSSSSGTAPTSTAPTSTVPTSTVPTSTASTTATEGKAPTTSALEPVVLQSADLPATWTPTPYTASRGDAAANAQVATCVGARDTSADQVAEVHSPDFTTAAAQIQSSAISFSSAADVRDDVTLVQSPKIAGCYKTLLNKHFASSLHGKAAIAGLQLKQIPNPAGAPSNVVAALNGTIAVQTTAGAKLSIYVAVAFITGRQSEAQVVYESVAQPIDGALFKKLVTAVAGRATKL